MIDHGNPFFTRFYHQRNAAREDWNREFEKEEIRRALYYCGELIKELWEFRNDDAARWMALHLWASKKCAAAFQEFVKQADRRLYYVDYVNRWDKDITNNHRIDALRNHRSILVETRARVSLIINGLAHPREMFLSGTASTRKRHIKDSKETLRELKGVRDDIDRCIETNERKLD